MAPTASILLASAALASLAFARTDLTGCTTTDVSSPAGASVAWYVPGTGELCDFLDCGGGTAPPRTDVPGCPLYSGTASYSPSFLPGFNHMASNTGASGATATATASGAISTSASSASSTTWAASQSTAAVTTITSAASLTTITQKTTVASASASMGMGAHNGTLMSTGVSVPSSPMPTAPSSQNAAAATAKACAGLVFGLGFVVAAL